MKGPNRPRSELRQYLPPALVSLGIFLLGLTLTITNKWIFLVQNSGEFKFGDLRNVTTTAGCVLNPEGRDAAGSMCSTWLTDTGSYPPAPYNYPTYWFKFLAFIGLGGESTNFLGIALIAMFALSMGFLTWLTLRGKAKYGASLGVFFLALTPPALLAMERGNTDLLAFTLMVLGILSLQSNRPWLALGFFTSATVFKLFPFGAGVALLGRGRRQAVAFGVFAAASTIGVISYFSELSYMASRTPQATFPSYGVSVFPMVISKYVFFQELDANAARIVGLVSLLLVIVSIVGLAKKIGTKASLIQDWGHLINFLIQDRTAKLLFLPSVGTFTLSYLLGSSFDYRAIFLLPAALALIRMSDSLNPISFTTLVSAIVFLILSNSSSTYSIVGDLILLGLVPFLMITLFELLARLWGKSTSIFAT
jgi:hypothetical protein